MYDAETRPTPSPLAYVMGDQTISSDLLEVTVGAQAQAVGRRIIDLQLPPEVLVMLIGRDEMIVPRGDTVFQAEDRVLLLGNRAKHDQLRALFEGKQWRA